jgi:hypothetical protein
MIMSVPREYIKVGNLIWYSGETSMSGWDCPAAIIEVNEEEEWFRVRSLDDLREQSQRYAIDPAKDHSGSRAKMFVPTRERVLKYVAQRKNARQDAIDQRRIEIVRLERERDAFAELLDQMMEKA